MTADHPVISSCYIARKEDFQKCLVDSSRLPIIAVYPDGRISKTYCTSFIRSATISSQKVDCFDVVFDMQAITTSVIKRGGKKYIVAKTASGKTSTLQVDTSTPPESDHRTVAQKLGVRLGFEGELIGGETHNGFAYVPCKVSFADLEKAVTCLIRAAAAFPKGEKDPIRLASGIIDLMKKGVVQ